MVKKAIAGVLSAVMCATTLLYDAPFGSRNTAQEGEQAPAASTGVQEKMGLTGSNSLSRYLARQGTEQAAEAKHAAQPLKAAAADAVYAVTNLDFDRETGIIQVTSTQSEAATLRASFIDEDSPANVYTVDFGVPAGEYVHSTFSADPAQLPEYFTVSVQLIGRAGLPLCKAFEIKTYHREMQEIIQTEASDFAPEQVVNLDEDETTNFIVLSEDTVRAETTEESNVLVSADYDQNIYVFDHIDESIRSLEKGQYFYIQPTEDDIISTDIQDIVIDGDTATITGTGEIDDMFDFIKIEIDTTQTVVTDDVPGAEDINAADAVCEEEMLEAEESDCGYLGVNAQEIDSKLKYDQRLNDLKKLDRNIQLTEYKVKRTIKKDFKTSKGTFVATPAFTIDTTIKWNLYKNFGYTNLFFVCDTKMSVTLTGKLSKKTPSEIKKKETEDAESGASEATENNDEDDLEEIPEQTPSVTDEDPSSESGDGKQEDKSPKHLFKIPIMTYGAADIYAFIDVGLTLSVEGQIGAEKKFTKGFVFDSDKGFETINFDTDPIITQANVKGSLTLDVKVGFEVSALKGLVTGSVAGGFKATATAQLASKSTGIVDNQTYNKNGTSVFKADPETESMSIHADEKCIKIDITFKVYIEVKVTAGLRFDNDKKIFKALGKLRFEKSFTYVTDEIMGHKLPKYVVFCSYNTSGVYKDWDFNFYKLEGGKSVDCPHKAYRLSFLIDFLNAPAGTSANLQIDGETYTLNIGASTAKLVLHAVPRSTPYVYYINVDGQRKISDSVKMTNGSKVVTHTISWPSDGTGAPNPTVGTGVVEEGPAITTVTQTTVKEEEPVFDYSEFIPPDVMISRGEEQYSLGENISGMFSNDGTFSVYGYGDMNAPINTLADIIPMIQRVEFYDQDPDSGLYINNISDYLFQNAANLEVVYMPEHLTAIGGNAFNGCKNLKWLRYGGGGDTTQTFKLPETLKTIGDSAFSGCSKAEFGDLRISASVTSIGYSAFANCPKITSVRVPGTSGTPTVIGQAAFANCTGLTEAYLGEPVRLTNGSYSKLLTGCTALQKLTIPAFNMGSSTVTWRLQYLFNGTNDIPAGLTEVTVLSGTEIPEYFFDNFPQLQTITYPDNITAIGKCAFIGCSALRSASLPETLTSIGDSAFSGCSKAEFGDLRIPASVTSIGASAFSNCLKIKTLVIPGAEGTETVISQAAFANCPELTEVYLGKTIRLTNGSYSKLLTGCTALQKLTIPAFNMGSSTVTWRLQYLFNGTDDIPAGLTEVAVLSGTEIPEYFFSNFNSLTSVTFSAELEKVEKTAFNSCTLLAKAYLIGEDADWDKVDIVETGNQPLLDIVRKEGRLVAILADPQDQTVEDGKTALFYVYAAGKYELEYHWQYSADTGASWTALDSDGTNRLAVEASPEKDGYMYRCVITDGGHSGRTTSGGATLTVTEKPKIPGKAMPEGYQPGDANGDGAVDVSDAVLIARFAVGDVSAKIKDIGVLNGDVNGDGNTDIQDVTFVLMFIAKRITLFPVEET